MRIALDLTSTPKSKTGIGRYMLGLIKGLQQVDKENEYYLFAQDDDLDGFGVYAENFHMVPCKAGILRKQWVRILWEQFVFPWRLKKIKADVLHCPNYTMPYPLRLISPKTAVVSAFHDMAYFSFPELYVGWKREMFKWYIKRSARSTDKIITISNNSKDDIPKYCKPRNTNITVTYMGVAEEFYTGTPADDATLSKYGIDSNYIYYVGTLEPRKNVAGLIKGYRLLSDPVKSKFKLVITGKKGWFYDELFSMVNSDPELKDQVVFTGFVDDQDMIPLMKRASTAAYVSLYEGFGIPVAEAMAAGVPVVTSNRSSMKEIAEGFGFLADPGMPESIRDNLEEALKLGIQAQQGGQDAQNKIKAAQDHARIFSWETCAEGTVKAFGEAYGRRHA
ncbi:MAG: glycosyltransferase family 4 protein [Saccharofermentans sp.]|nr:glycosyltransferase family 4 protein [Saccharofermentans sp.]